MKLSELAAKEKRIKSWSELLKLREVSPKVKKRLEKELEIFKELLANCFEEGRITQADIDAVEDVERRLELLGDEARLRTR